MVYEVAIEDVAPRRLAAVRESLRQSEIPQRIQSLLGEVWTHLRANGVPTDHNIAVYERALQRDGELVLDAVFGVEVLADFEPNARVVKASTPTGRVATAVHWGDYSGISEAHAALDQWCSEHGFRSDGPHWEVYGDWFDDPAKVRTDVFVLLA